MCASFPHWLMITHLLKVILSLKICSEVAVGRFLRGLQSTLNPGLASVSQMILGKILKTWDLNRLSNALVSCVPGS